MAPRSLSHRRVAVQQAPHPDGLDVQRHVQVLRRHGEEILRDRLLGVGVGVAAHGGRDVGQLVGGQPRAAAKHHVRHALFEGRAKS